MKNFTFNLNKANYLIKIKIKYSFNLKQIENKEFEIFLNNDQQKLQQLEYQQRQQQQQQQQGYESSNIDLNSYLYIGHKENEINLDLLFHFDIGQIILSEGIHPDLLLMKFLFNLIKKFSRNKFYNRASSAINAINGYKCNTY